MVTVVVNGLPSFMGEELDKKIVGDIKNAIISIKELGVVNPREISVLLPVSSDSGDELLIVITLFRKLTRTPIVLKCLSETVVASLHNITKEFIPRCHLIKVVPLAIDPKTQNCFSVWRSEKDVVRNDQIYLTPILSTRIP